EPFRELSKGVTEQMRVPHHVHVAHRVAIVLRNLRAQRDLQWLQIGERKLHDWQEGMKPRRHEEHQEELKVANVSDPEHCRFRLFLFPCHVSDFLVPLVPWW